MGKLRVLIVEDEILIAMDLESIIAQATPSIFTMRVSVAATIEVLGDPFDFAFLDVDVTNGKTFEIARLLSERRIPFAFVSASSQSQLPEPLQSVPFIPKPYAPAAVIAVLPSRDTHKQ